MSQLLYIVLGLVAGISAGIFGIGGGTILIPLLVFIFGLSQHQAQGTTLAVMIPPIGLLAALRYYYSGNVKLDMVGFICLGFFVGGLIGASLIQNLPELVLKKAFGVFLLFISIKMILAK
ncbi:MAG: sulfite exporter TauE/SafE family protein [Candidatus Omnitrophica bacterium]|nr:sulfite exporter TauE/SafE family protein [Candidatus Omnitrophota bacterium]MBU4346804.1 sulfite exporter TauE/SafE family protein [Candidatus Omnitrophota bacterium]MBU4472885.1 sulfite exporter TauE/SafE family protein [Candidatus Omnitrophota bacterium]MCG2706119.1 sulfite exporter TauE/SafE family protein [Candidatus Omnitrophota bacterium]